MTIESEIYPNKLKNRNFVKKALRLVLPALLLLGVLFTILPSRNELVFKKVLEIHKKSLPYLHEAHPSLMILFSGTPGMGKTVVAKRIEEKFHAVRLSSDDVRPLLREQGLKEDLVNTYLEWCAHRLAQTESNHFLVFDKSIDRTFNRYSGFAQDHLYPIFLVQMQAQRPAVEARIRSRGRDVENTLRQLSFAWKDYENFGRSHTVDYVLVNDDNIEASLE